MRMTDTTEKGEAKTNSNLFASHVAKLDVARVPIQSLVLHKVIENQLKLAHVPGNAQVLAQRRHNAHIDVYVSIAACSRSDVVLTGHAIFDAHNFDLLVSLYCLHHLQHVLWASA